MENGREKLFLVILKLLRDLPSIYIETKPSQDPSKNVQNLLLFLGEAHKLTQPIKVLRNFRNKFLHSVTMSYGNPKACSIACVTLKEYFQEFDYSHDPEKNILILKCLKRCDAIILMGSHHDVDKDINDQSDQDTKLIPLINYGDIPTTDLFTISKCASSDKCTQDIKEDGSIIGTLLQLRDTHREEIKGRTITILSGMRKGKIVIFRGWNGKNAKLSDNGQIFFFTIRCCSQIYTLDRYCRLFLKIFLSF